MNLKQAWEIFEKTGSIDAYLRYTALRSSGQLEEDDAICDAGTDRSGEPGRRE